MNQNFEFVETEISGTYLIKVFNAPDIRGCFTKDYSQGIFEKMGLIIT